MRDVINDTRDFVEYFSGAVWLEVTEIDNDAPDAPSNLTVTAGDGYLDIAWDAVTGATGYDVRAKASGSTTWTDVASSITTTTHRYTTSATIDYVAVRARNASGPGAWTQVSRLPDVDFVASNSNGVSNNVARLGMASAQSGGQVASTKPGTPSSVTLTRDNYPYDEKLFVTWSAVTGATGYNVVCSDKGGWQWWSCGTVSSGSTTTYTVDREIHGDINLDLKWRRSYRVAVQAVKNNVRGDWTDTEDAHPAFPPAVVNPITTARGNGSITLTWTPPPYAQGYEIDCATSENDVSSAYTRCADVETATVTNGKINETITSWTVDGTTYTIDNTKIYDLRVRTTNAWGDSPFSFAPLIPAMNLTVSNITWYTARFTLTNYPGSWYYKATSGPHTTCQGPVNSSFKDIAGLSEGGTYTYSAYSDNRCDDLLVAAGAFTTQSLAVTNIAQTTATITMTGYTGNWYYRADTGPHSSACNGPISGSTAVDLTGLSAGTPYTYRAYDDNTCFAPPAGTAVEIAYARFTTIQTTLTASNLTNTGATLTIANHAGNWYYKHSGASATCEGPVTGNSKSLTNLTSGTSYTYSAYSDSSCATQVATATEFTLGEHYISNLGSAKSDGGVINIDYSEAFAFTTGGNANGYTLTSVTLPLRVSQQVAVDPLVITLHAMEGGGSYGTGSAPSSTALATLSGTDPTGAAWADTTYTCSGSGCSLSASTTYFVVASVKRGEYSWAYTEANPHPEPTYPSNSGWDIGYSHTKELVRSWFSHGDWHLAKIVFTTTP